MSRNDSELSLSLLKSNPSAASRKRALVEAKRNNDQVFMALYSDKLTYKDMKMLVSGFKNTARAKDILMAYRMLSALMKYLDESESWSFNMLNNYDFQRAVRQFDLDVAIVVGARAERLLAEIYSWNIPHLKKSVMGFSSYASDDATILTVLVFRILNEYSTLEFTLQLALSRATLIKIHHEMSSLFSKLPGGAENSQQQYSGEEQARNEALVNAYRGFVTSLLEELESTPFESVQQELFQIVRDLHTMFHKFSDAQQQQQQQQIEGLKGLETQQRNRKAAPQQQPGQTSLNEGQYPSQKNVNASRSDILDDLFNQTQEENFMNLKESTNSGTGSTAPPLQEEWQNKSFNANNNNNNTNTSNTPNIPNTNDTNIPSPSPSTASRASSYKPQIPDPFIPRPFNRTPSESTYRATSSMVSSLTEELPHMLQAFEFARRRNEGLKNGGNGSGSGAGSGFFQNSDAASSSSKVNMSTPPETPNRSSSTAATAIRAPYTSNLDAGLMDTPNSTTSTNTAYAPSSPASSVGNNGSVKQKKKRSSGTPLLFGGMMKNYSGSNSTATATATSPANHSSPTNHASPNTVSTAADHHPVPVTEEQSVQVKMINGRMMVKIDGKYVDMQEWADHTNTVTEASVHLAQHPSYSIANNDNIQQSVSNRSLNSILHAEAPLHAPVLAPLLPSPPASTTSNLSINTQDSTSTGATSVMTTAVTASNSPLTPRNKMEDSGLSDSMISTSSANSGSGNNSMAQSGYGITALFNPWLKPTKLVTAGGPSTSPSTENTLTTSTSNPAPTPTTPTTTGTESVNTDVANNYNSNSNSSNEPKSKPMSTLEYLQQEQLKAQKKQLKQQRILQKKQQQMRQQELLEKHKENEEKRAKEQRVDGEVAEQQPIQKQTFLTRAPAGLSVLVGGSGNNSAPAGRAESPAGSQAPMGGGEREKALDGSSNNSTIVNNADTPTDDPASSSSTSHAHPSQRAAMHSSSWIKSLIGPSEGKFS